ncbi:MAG: hypothetical protein IIW27_03070 [Clostridia bacterium]|jgi:DNA repair protein RadC|nr:hypothetical protein [Clostridia bacterium]
MDKDQVKTEKRGEAISKEIHEGHRARMMRKLITDSAVLTDCELLEIALYQAIPRANTNPLAHELLARFGNLQAVFSAPPEELILVRGMGEKAVQILLVLGEMFNRLGKREISIPKKFSFDSVKNFFLTYFADKRNEEFMVMFIDKRDSITKTSVTAHGDKNGVNINLTELSKEIGIAQPHAIIVAHNHPSGMPYPSAADDDLTMKINFMLDLAGVRFYDHIVVAGKNYYSYRVEGRMDKLQAQSSFARFSDYLKNE